VAVVVIIVVVVGLVGSYMVGTLQQESTSITRTTTTTVTTTAPPLTSTVTTTVPPITTTVTNTMPPVTSTSTTTVFANPGLFITSNAGFELNDNSWVVISPSGSSAVASIVSGGASSGSRSLYINDPGQSISVWYNDSTSRVLPLLINPSITFDFDLLFKGNAVPQGNGAALITLFLSWRLLPNETFPLTIMLGNYSAYSDSTYDSVNASAGITMLRGVKTIGSWASYDLQLGTSRVDSLIKAYLLTNSSTLYNTGDPIYVMGFRIAADNAAAYFDNVGLYNNAPPSAYISLGQSTFLRSDW